MDQHRDISCIEYFYYKVLILTIFKYVINKNNIKFLFQLSRYFLTVIQFNPLYYPRKSYLELTYNHRLLKYNFFFWRGGGA